MSGASSFRRHLNPFDRKKIERFSRHASRMAALNYPFPTHVVLFPTYRCNHRCGGCLYGIPKRKWQGEMKEETFDRVVALLSANPGTHVDISGGGEPSCHAGFRRILERLAPHAGQLGLITNGGALESGDLQSIAQTCHHVRFSLDSVNPKTYKKIRGADANLDATLANLGALASLGRKRSPRLHVGAKFLISRINAGELGEILSWARDARIDYVQFKAARRTGQELDAAAQDALDSEIQLAKEHRQGGPEIHGSLQRIRGKGPCWASPAQMVIDPLGDVYICCYYVEREDTLRLGNLTKAPFDIFWGNLEHRNKLRRIETRACPYDCRFKMYNEMLSRHASGPHD